MTITVIPRQTFVAFVPENQWIVVGVGPYYFDKPSDAWALASAAARALREAGKDPGAVATLPNFAVKEALEEEIDSTTTAFFEDKIYDAWENWRTPRWVESLRSITPRSDGTVPLDADQAVALVDCLSTALDTVENFEGDNAEHEAIALRTALVQIESQCGLWVEFHGNDDYSIRINMEGESGNYRIKYQDENLGCTDTVAAAYDLVQKHRGPPVGSQLTIEQARPDV